MAVYCIPEVYKSVVEEKAQGYLKDILEKSPESRVQAQQDLSALIQRETEELKLNELSEEKVKEKLYLLRRATLLTAQLGHPDPNILMPVLMQIAEEKVAQEEIIEKARSIGIGVGDEESIYIA